MSRTFFTDELDTAASWWRIFRRDGVALAFVTHDTDLWFDGHLHRAAPGLLPSAIRRTIDFADDEAEVDGALSHDTITEADLRSGKFDGARIEMGIVDWNSTEAVHLYSGSIASVMQDANSFSAQLRSVKADLAVDTVPRTSPSCRARFCGPRCTLPPLLHTVRSHVVALDIDSNRVSFAVPDAQLFENGEFRWIDGPHSGQVMTILAAESQEFVVAELLSPKIEVGHRVDLREGCDKTIQTCGTRFGNALNFQGEPHLPGNDLLAQYPQPR